MSFSAQKTDAPLPSPSVSSLKARFEASHAAAPAPAPQARARPGVRVEGSANGSAPPSWLAGGAPPRAEVPLNPVLELPQAVQSQGTEEVLVSTTRPRELSLTVPVQTAPASVSPFSTPPALATPSPSSGSSTTSNPFFPSPISPVPTVLPVPPRSASPVVPLRPVPPTSTRPPPPTSSNATKSAPLPSTLERVVSMKAPPPPPPPSRLLSRADSRSATSWDEGVTLGRVNSEGAAKPLVPPRPVAHTGEPADTSVPSTSTRAPPPLPTRLPEGLSRHNSLVGSPSSVVSLPLPVTPALASAILPPPRKMAPPAPPATPSRPIEIPGSLLRRASTLSSTTVRNTSLPLPTISNSAPDDEATPYLPPPPPSRAIPPSSRLAPQRPGKAVLDRSPTGSGDSSDEEDEPSETLAKSYPDATFANRRPPAMLGSRSIHAQGQVFSWTVRGRKVVTGQHHAYVWDSARGAGAAEPVSLPGGEHKIHAVEFKAAGAEEKGNDGRFVWGGTRDGHLFEIDTVELRVANVRQNIHPHSISHIFRHQNSMVTLDESGKLLMWGTPTSPTPAALTSTPKAQRIQPILSNSFVGMIGAQLWTSSGPNTKSTASALSARSPQIRIFDPQADGPFALTPKAITTPESAGHIGAVTSGTLVPSQPGLVYLGHDDGNVSVWSSTTYTCVYVQRVSPFQITALVGAGRFLWAGYRNGFITVYEVEREGWRVRKSWKAHKESVTKLVVDPSSLWSEATLPIASSGADQVVHFWDGFLREDWLASELDLRQVEFCTFRSIRTLVISWNIGTCRPVSLSGSVQNLEFLTQCLTSVDGPDIISFGFQEVIDLESKSLTAKTMLLGKKKGDALTDRVTGAGEQLSDSVSGAYRLWYEKLVQAVRLAMPPECPYVVISASDLVGLFSCIFVKQSEYDGLRDIASIRVKTGLGGRYGNKGGIITRFVMDDTSLLFTNVHLAAGQRNRRARDRDLVDILEDKSTFSSLNSSSPGAYAAGGSGLSVFDHEICIISGDLNYRIDERRDVVLAAVEQGGLKGLLAQDQLLKGLATNQNFRLRSFKEAPLTFSPTYKYDPGTDNYDSSAKNRIPAWCDRVLYRAARAEQVKPLSYERYECNVSDHRPISFGAEVQIKSIIAEKRAAVWAEVERAWVGVEKDLLDKAWLCYEGC